MLRTMGLQLMTRDNQRQARMIQGLFSLAAPMDILLWQQVSIRRRLAIDTQPEKWNDAIHSG